VPLPIIGQTISHYRIVEKLGGEPSLSTARFDSVYQRSRHVAYLLVPQKQPTQTANRCLRRGCSVVTERWTSRRAVHTIAVPNYGYKPAIREVELAAGGSP